jgi:hypothetical protein
MIVEMRPLLERFPEDGQTISEMLRKAEDFSDHLPGASSYR